MKSLYFRLLIWLLIALSFVGASISIAYHDFFLDPDPPFADFLSHHLENTCRVIVQVDKQFGRDAAIEFMNSCSPNQRYQWYVYIPQDETFTLKRVPTALHNYLLEAIEDDEVHLFENHPTALYGATKKVTLHDGRHAVVLLEGKDIEPAVEALIFPFVVLVPTIALLLAIGGICYLFYRSLVRPLHDLQLAAGKLGKGDLSARVAPMIVRRKDEIADLAIAFNAMADRVEALIAAHKTLLQDVSHELRTPLTRLGLALELARSGSGGDLSVQFDRIEQETQRLDHLISQLLMLSRANADASQSDAEDVDLVAVLESIVDDARFEATTREINIELAYDTPIVVKANVQLLYSAIENVLRNALRHAPNGSQIDVSLVCDKTIAHLRIRDRGSGVPEAELSALFEPFHTVAPDEEAKTGTGIGLSITRRVIDQLDGEVRIRNAPDGGLECHIQLPLMPI